MADRVRISCRTGALAGDRRRERKIGIADPA
jgi:hypothetical protein